MHEENTTRRGKDYLLPASIVIAAVLISASLFYNAGTKKDTPNNSLNSDTFPAPEEVLTITDTDHVRGNKDAQVVLIEYSDLECPFCKQFQVTMNKVMETYGDRIAWVYRHFPIVGLHPKAPKEAEGAECAYEQGGDEAFWAYTDRIFEITPANNGLDLTLLPQVAKDIGLDSARFSSCLESNKYATFITEEAQRAENVMRATCQDPQGRCGTPYSLIATKDGNWYPLNGAYKYESLISILDQMLEQ